MTRESICGRIFDELLSEIYELRRGQRSSFQKEDQLPRNTVNVIPKEAGIIIYDGVLYRGQIPIILSQIERDN